MTRFISPSPLIPIYCAKNDDSILSIASNAFESLKKYYEAASACDDAPVDTHIVNVVEVTPDLKQYYENLITVIARSFLDADTIEQIEKIVVPEDFLSAVMDFQIKNGDENPSVTNNEFGRAFGKLLFNPETKKYVVFIDVMLATFIMDDTVFNACFNRLDEAALEEAKKKRQVSLNILAHELAHVEFALASNSTVMISPPITTQLLCQ